ncbi:MAG: hypothetical protein LC624_09195 [Halobacteriales archaeon]|nr:hypothetical protein [Halobacteriales archaeon]
MRASLRRLARDDDGVSEVLGYVLMFFLSAAVLVLSLQIFLQARGETVDLQVANELKLISERVAAEVQQAGVVASQFPNSTYNVTITLPELKDKAYYVNVSHDQVWANTSDGKATAQSDAFQVEALGLHLAGTVYGSQGYVKVQYATTSTGWKSITISI